MKPIHCRLWLFHFQDDRILSNNVSHLFVPFVRGILDHPVLHDLLGLHIQLDLVLLFCLSNRQLLHHVHPFVLEGLGVRFVHPSHRDQGYQDCP